MSAEELLKSGLTEMGISLSEDQTAAFMTYLSELKKWNRAYNLTALKNDRDIITKHFLDSLLYLKAIPGGAMELADAGSGAGFPGIPIKIARPGITLSLIEPSRKKTAFLRNIIRHLGLTGIHVHEERLENLGPGQRNKYDVILSRATFSSINFLTAACPFIKDSGILILNKGPKFPEEIKTLEGSEYSPDAVKEVLQVPLPLTAAKRNLIVLSCTMKK